MGEKNKFLTIFNSCRNPPHWRSDIWFYLQSWSERGLRQDVFLGVMGVKGINMKSRHKSRNRPIPLVVALRFLWSSRSDSSGRRRSDSSGRRRSDSSGSSALRFLCRQRIFGKIFGATCCDANNRGFIFAEVAHFFVKKHKQITFYIVQDTRITVWSRIFETVLDPEPFFVDGILGRQASFFKIFETLK